MGARKQKAKKFTDSNRKSSQRSSSQSSIGSQGSKGSQSSLSSHTSCSVKSYDDNKSSFTQNESKSLDTFKTIYKASDDPDPPKNYDDDPGVTIAFIAWLQGAISVYFSISIIYQLIWGQNEGMWFMMMEILLLELFGVLALITTTRKLYTGPCCIFLSIQYSLLFLLFSMFLHSSYKADSPFFERIFGLSAVCLMSSGLHFFIVIQSMKLIKESHKWNDYSEKMIVEGVEKRRKDLYLMISDLITEICYDDKDMKVHLTINDETGRPHTMRGAGVEAGVSRVLEMSADGQQVHLSTSNTTLAAINVPKNKKKSHKSHGSHGSRHDLAPIIDSKYNNCSKQDKMLSPRKILG